MNKTDEDIRDALTDAMSRDDIDARNLTVEVENRAVYVKGTVLTASERNRLEKLLSQCRDLATNMECEVGVADATPSDSLDGRGRSPFTGTSADSAHESRHQRDRR